MVMKRYPLAATHRDIGIELVIVAFLDHMHVLKTETLAGSHGCRCIVGLVYVFQNDRHMPGPVRYHTVHLIPLILGHIAFQIGLQKRFLIRTQGLKKSLILSISYNWHSGIEGYF